MENTSISPNNPDFAKPKGLSPKGEAAYAAIMRMFHDLMPDGVDAGGCTTFYSPAEWEARGEVYSQDAELVVVYDGGEVGIFFDYDKAYEFGTYSWQEKMADALLKLGLYFECGTCWYGGVYNI